MKPQERTRAILRSGLDHESKGVAIAIADYMGEQEIAWPSVDTIAADAGLSERTTQRRLRTAEADGWLKAHRVAGKATAYSITWSALPARPEGVSGGHPRQADTGVTETPGGVRGTPPGVSGGHPKGPVEGTMKGPEGGIAHAREAGPPLPPDDPFALPEEAPCQTPTARSSTSTASPTAACPTSASAAMRATSTPTPTPSAASRPASPPSPASSAPLPRSGPSTPPRSTLGSPTGSGADPILVAGRELPPDLPALLSAGPGVDGREVEALVVPGRAMIPWLLRDFGIGDTRTLLEVPAERWSRIGAKDAAPVTALWKWMGRRWGVGRGVLAEPQAAAPRSAYQRPSTWSGGIDSASRAALDENEQVLRGDFDEDWRRGGMSEELIASLHDDARRAIERRATA